jgi:hypothetical protein
MHQFCGRRQRVIILVARGEWNSIQVHADLLLALIVILFAMIAPVAKIVGLSCIQITPNGGPL